ncbi:MAG: 50S ribosomal protein L18 [Phycisphaerales bacterium]
MKRTIERRERRQRRKDGGRKNLLGVPERPRMTVYRSLKHTYVQVINDLEGKTLASASTKEKGSTVSNGSNRDAAADVGKRIAERAKAAGVSQVVFDRNGYRYHGRIKSLADAAREAGLTF